MLAVAAGVLLVAAVAGAVRGRDTGDAASPASSGTAIDVRDFQFGPGELAVPVGATVTWTNRDGFDHTVRGDAEVPGRSEVLSEGDIYEFTFTEAGTYEYFCTIHVSMRGTVVVGGGSS